MKKRLWMGAALATLLFVCAAWISFDVLFFPFGEDGQTVEIADYCGKEIDRLSFSEWIEVTTEYRYDKDVPSGVILSQSPIGGSRRKLTERHPTCALTLTVSLGEETAKIPNVLGLDAREAESRLREAGFSVQKQESYGAYPSGEVCDMQPRADETVPLGTLVTLSVSAGNPERSVTVPNLCGMSRADALMSLWMAELSLGEVVEETSDAAAGTVLRQSHQAGTLVRAGTAVTIYVAAQGRE